MQSRADRVKGLFASTFCLGILVFAACGDSGQTPADKAFGDTSERDRQAFRDLVTSMEEFPHSNAEFSRSLQEEDIGSAQAALDEMTTQLDEADDIAFTFDNAKARDVVQDYNAVMRKLTATYQRLLILAEDPYADASAIDDVLADVQDAVLAAQRADRAFANRILDVLPPDQRREFADKIGQLHDQLREEATPQP